MGMELLAGNGEQEKLTVDMDILAHLVQTEMDGACSVRTNGSMSNS